MVAANWPTSLGLLLKSEGGNDDDPSDHGGRTSRGVTQRTYDAWCILNHHPLQDVWLASGADIAEIYHSEYWNPYCDLIPKGPDYLFFDFNVNAGPHQSAVLLQRALGVTADGHIGPVTQLAVQSADAGQLITRFSDAKADFYKSLHQPKYLNGWLNRVQEVKINALEMVNQ